MGVVDWDRPEFKVGYVVDREHEGRGFVSEALRATLRWLFDGMRAARVRAECNETNERSIRVLERCGFAREGCLRSRHAGIRRADGAPSGDYLYGMLADERPRAG